MSSSIALPLTFFSHCLFSLQLYLLTSLDWLGTEHQDSSVSASPAFHWECRYRLGAAYMLLPERLGYQQPGDERMKTGQTHIQPCWNFLRFSASQLAHVDNGFDNLSWTIVLRILGRSCSCQNTHSPGSTLTQGFPHLNFYVDVGGPNSGSNFAWTVCVTL